MKKKDDFRILLENLPDAFAYHKMLTDSRGIPQDYLFLEVNPAFETMTGLHKDQVLGKCFSEVYPEIFDRPLDWIKNSGRVAAGEGSIRFDHYFELVKRWYEVTAYSDVPGYFATVFRDITEHKRLLNTLRESEENLFITLHSIGDGVITTDLDRNVTRMNPQAVKLTGWTFKEASGKPVDEVFYTVHTKTGEPAPNPIRHVIETGETLNLANDTALLSRDGNIYQIADSAAPIRDTLGKITGAILVFSDVTEQYLARKTMEETAARLEYILNATRTGIDIVDENYNLHYVDNIWKSIYGPPGERKCYEYFKGRSDPCDNCGVPRALETKEIILSEQILPREDNRVVQCHTVPFQNEQGEWLAAEFNTDITERKQLEERLRFQLHFEKMVSSIAGTFVDTDPENIDEVVQLSLQRIGNFFQADRGVIFQFSSTGGSLGRTHEWCAEGIEPLAGRLKRFTSKKLPWLLTQIHKMEHISTFDVNELPPEAAAEKKEFLRQGIQSFIILPFPAANGPGLKSFLGFDSVKEKKDWTEEQINLLRIVAEIIAGAFKKRQAELERNKALELLKESESRYRTIVKNITDALFIIDFDMRIKDFNEAAHKMLGYDRKELMGASMTMITGPEEQKYAAQRMEQLLQKDRLFFEETLIHKNAALIPVEVSLKVVSREGKGLIQGFIRDITRRKQDEQQIANYTMQMENLYQKLDKEIKRAKEVHRRTLPKKLPAVKGVSFAAYYQPAERLGGDFYDVIQLDNKLIFYLSDVTGHGVDGAMLSMFIKHTIKGYLTFSPEEKVRPEKILSHLSTQFRQKNLSEEYFICIFLAVLDLESMKLTYTAAGFQDTPLVSLGDGEKQSLISKGLFLSPAFPEELLNLQEESIQLTPGSTVLFNTDGLTQQIVRGVYYGKRLPAVFYENCHLPPQLLAQIVRNDFQMFNEGSLQSNDDITFLVLQIEPNPKKVEHLELASDFAGFKQLREKIYSLLGNCKEAYLFLASMHELISNAIEHGNLFDKMKKVSVEFVVTEKFIQATVEDEGEGFDWQAHTDRPLELDGISERGRGIALIRTCSDYLFYNEKGNGATLIINL
ncbi:MAG: PAS domain S-box protein [Firmicutes bacterium]|nr:PAS domain S-box protein [Bacillota bacterium]